MLLNFQVKNQKFIKEQAEWVAKKYKLDPEDLAAELNLKLLKNITFEGNEAQFRGYIRIVIKNLAVDLYRYEKRHPVMEKSYQDIAETYCLQPDSSAGIFVKNVSAFVHGLKGRRVEIFEMVVLNYQTYEETAMRLNIPTGTVKCELHRLRLLLKKKFGERYKEF